MSTHVCVCHRVDEDEIVSWIRRGVVTIDGLGEYCDAGTGCSDCHEMLEELIEDFWTDDVALRAEPEAPIGSH
ncbi:BFD-like [2Fe-2S] binding protein [Micromonospora sp. A202]|uniref:(2Fe-2S)-binding protein n=1 Tax=Micromonospora sp. A202 TaxID=2572899 RepID=UPI00116C91CC|nr:(2Fe-2S)-binding protein [Micromonospora sp. A202]TQJ23677.1 BFD-like [2Fe-2S] binding protein [Micromonospora sp. A202]